MRTVRSRRRPTSFRMSTTQPSISRGSCSFTAKPRAPAPRSQPRAPMTNALTFTNNSPTSANTPALQRRLGLIIDLDVDLAGIPLTTGGHGLLRVEPKFTTALSPTTTFITADTAYTLTSSAFRPASGGSPVTGDCRRAAESGPGRRRFGDTAVPPHPNRSRHRRVRRARNAEAGGLRRRPAAARWFGDLAFRRCVNRQIRQWAIPDGRHRHRADEDGQYCGR